VQKLNPIQTQTVQSIFSELVQLRLQNLVQTLKEDGEVYCFSTLVVQENSVENFTIQGFYSRLSLPDIHYYIKYDYAENTAVVDLILHTGNPADDYDVIKQQLVSLLSTAKLRVKQMEKKKKTKKSGGRTYPGLTLVPGTCGKKSRENFDNQIATKKLSQEFKKYCIEYDFQLKYCPEKSKKENSKSV